MALPTNKRDMRGPYTIQFKTDLDIAFGQDMSAYIEKVVLDERLEDVPYTFIQNELRVFYWDHDGGFIRRNWDTDISELTVLLTSQGAQHFQGRLTVPSDKAVTKKAALGIDEKSKTGKLIFTPDIEQFEKSIEIVEVEVIVDDPTPDGGPITVIRKQLKRDGVSYSLESNQYRPNWFRLDRILNYLFRGRLDHTDINETINNSNGNCTYFIDRRYFEGQNRTTLEFLKAVAQLFDAYVTFDPIELQLYLFTREETNVSDTLPDESYTKDWEGNQAQYTGIELHYNPPPTSWFRGDHVEGASFAKFDSDGNKILYRTSNLPRENEVTILIGNGNGSILDFDLELLRYVTTYDFDFGDVPSAELPDDFDNIVPSSILLRTGRMIALANAALKYGKADIIVQMVQDAENVPIVGGLYTESKNSTNAGYVTELVFDSESREVEYTWKQNLSFTGEISRDDFDGSRPGDRDW